MTLGMVHAMFGHEPLQWLQDLQAQASVGDFFFFRLILDYLHKEIAEFGIKLLGRMMKWVGAIALILMTLWVLIQGFRIATGQSRDSMMVLVTNMARAALIVSVATSMAMFGEDLHGFLINDVKNEISYVITGKDESPEDLIDKNLGYMQIALSAVDALDVMGDVTLDSAKTRAMWFVGLGTGGRPSPPARCCCCTRWRWPCSSALALCSSSACYLIRPSSSSRNGCCTG